MSSLQNKTFLSLLSVLHTIRLSLAYICLTMVGSLLSYIGLGGSAPASSPSENSAVRALPGNWYTSEEMYQLERRAIFSRRWLILTHKSRLQKPGDWLRYNCANYDFVVSKDRNGEIHAFHNVCRHRAYPVVEKEEGNSKILQCKYHGWSYGLNGKLAKAPGYQDMQGFDKAKNGLLDHSYTMEGDFNWKILADNFNECYHCKTTHPDLPDIANLETYDVNCSADHIDHDPKSSPEQVEKGMNICSTYLFPYSSYTIR